MRTQMSRRFSCLLTLAFLHNNVIMNYAGNGWPCSDFRIDDPLWHLQWYLNATDEQSYDINVLPAWRQCFSGKNITIGVVEGGFDKHVDLNIDNSLLYDSFNDSNPDKSHGTRVAGILSSKKSNHFGIGIAYDAYLADLRMLSGPSSSANDPKALTAHLDFIDIYSASFVKLHHQWSMHPLDPEVENNLKRGTEQGRQNKGSIYVWATGNYGSGSYPGSCTYDGYCNNIYVISVGGILKDLSKVPTGEKCSSILISAITSQANIQELQIVTTDGINDSTIYFNQNSAAVPMVSGAIALALEVNNNLTYRDVMHLLVKSARRNIQYNTDDFIVNAAGISFSRTFGAGLLDVESLVELSRNWTNVPLRRKCASSSFRKSSGDEFTIRITASKCNINFCEHVGIKLKYSSAVAEKIKWILKSPGKTSSEIISGRQLNNADSLDIFVISVHFWEEDPIGEWELKAVNGTDDIRDLSIRLEIYGYTYSNVSQDDDQVQSTTPISNNLNPYRLHPEDYKVLESTENDVHILKNFMYGIIPCVAFMLLSLIFLTVFAGFHFGFGKRILKRMKFENKQRTTNEKTQNIHQTLQSFVRSQEEMNTILLERMKNLTEKVQELRGIMELKGIMKLKDDREKMKHFTPKELDLGKGSEQNDISPYSRKAIVFGSDQNKKNLRESSIIQMQPLSVGQQLLQDKTIGTNL